jgi:hypothetical protein
MDRLPTEEEMLKDFLETTQKLIHDDRQSPAMRELSRDMAVKWKDDLDEHKK